MESTIGHDFTKTLKPSSQRLFKATWSFFSLQILHSPSFFSKPGGKFIKPSSSSSSLRKAFFMFSWKRNQSKLTAQDKRTLTALILATGAKVS